MATLGDLTTEVAEEIGSINATDDQVKIWRFLNRGVRDFLRRTRCYVQSETFTPGATLNYTLDATVLAVVDIYWTGSTMPLERVSVQEIHRLRRATAATATGYPRYYAYQNPLILWNIAPGASETVTVVNVPVPTAASNSSHDLADATYGGIPADYHDAIALYAEWKLASYDDDSSSAQGSRYKEWYEQRIQECKRELSGKGGARLPKATVGRTRYALPHDPSADWRY